MRTGTRRTKAMHPVKTSHTGSPELPYQKNCSRPRKTSGTPHVDCLVTVPPCRSYRGKHLENQTHHHWNTSGLRKRQYVWEPLGAPLQTKNRIRNFIHPKQCGIFPKRLTLPYRDEEISSGCEEDVSSIRDGFSAWVKTDPEITLRRHIVDAKGANPASREVPARKHSPSCQEYHFNSDVFNLLIEQRRLSVNSWNPERSSYRKTYCGEVAHHYPARSN